MLSKTKKVISKCLGSIKQDTKIKLEQIKPYFYIKCFFNSKIEICSCYF